MAHVMPETPPAIDETRLIERPDGFYWQSKVTGREYGPFASLIEAVQDMDAQDDSMYEPGETAEEAMAELGIAEWNDPLTGEPAEEDGTRLSDY